MSERPLICRAHEVRAILAGAQTQTRRLVKPPPTVHPKGTPTWYPSPEHKRRLAYDGPEHFARGMPLDFAPYAIGDTLWVRETWAPHPDDDNDPPEWVVYRADRGWWGCGAYSENTTRNLGKLDPSYADPKWRPSIQMPRWASRISLRVTSVRVKQLDQITEADAEAEGVRRAAPVLGHLDAEDCARLSARGLFAELWEHVHGDGAWERDRERWVWVVGFERVGVARG